MDLSTSPPDLLRRLGTSQAIQIIDVCVPEDVQDLPVRLPGAIRVAHANITDHAGQLDPAKPVVVVCQKGLKLSHGAAAFLRGDGFRATALEGGISAWHEAGLPTISEIAPDTLYALPSPANPAALFEAWLIHRWIAPNANLLWVPAAMCSAVADRFDGTGAVGPTEMALAAALNWTPLNRFLRATDAQWTALLAALPKLHRTPEGAFSAALPIIDAAWTALRSDART